jgi:hypothetical protein
MSAASSIRDRHFLQGFLLKARGDNDFLAACVVSGLVLCGESRREGGGGGTKPPGRGFRQETRLECGNLGHRFSPLLIIGAKTPESSGRCAGPTE